MPRAPISSQVPSQAPSKKLSQEIWSFQAPSQASKELVARVIVKGAVTEAIFVAARYAGMISVLADHPCQSRS